MSKEHKILSEMYQGMIEDNNKKKIMAGMDAVLRQEALRKELTEKLDAAHKAMDELDGLIDEIYDLDNETAVSIVSDEHLNFEGLKDTAYSINGAVECILDGTQNA